MCLYVAPGLSGPLPKWTNVTVCFVSSQFVQVIESFNGITIGAAFVDVQEPPTK